MNDHIKREDVKSLFCKYCDYARRMNNVYIKREEANK